LAVFDLLANQKCFVVAIAISQRLQMLHQLHWLHVIRPPGPWSLQPARPAKRQPASKPLVLYFQLVLMVVVDSRWMTSLVQTLIKRRL
jgi:hypothetical protein